MLVTEIALLAVLRKYWKIEDILRDEEAFIFSDFPLNLKHLNGQKVKLFA